MKDGVQIEELERRTAALEKAVMGKETREVLKLDLTLPEADIEGLHFYEQKVHAVFEKRTDGWYHSRDILFMSARNSKDDNSRDILTEYLNRHEGSDSIKAQIAPAMKAASAIHVEIALPEENEGVKKYNGADCWYWLEGKPAASSAYFARIGHSGNAASGAASAVGGCAPVFRIRG
jgi:hypothetical protein